MKQVHIHDKKFEVLVPSQKIQEGIASVAEKINQELDGKRPVFICVLNGAFIFAADLLKKITIDCEISFVKLASYYGTTSSGEVKTLIGLDENVKNRTVVILEDIVDTGLTVETIVKQLSVFEPAQIKIATLLLKPDAYNKNIPIDYTALTVPNDFLVGFGLDYDGLGRNLEDIYVLVK
jgi:hypoxanthine phosphoribosyltransferase